jgi:hypothetical protein
MLAYIINLESRKDRWSSALAQAELLGIPICRIQAIKTADLSQTECEYAAPGVAATWLSHRKAALEFLKSDYEYALILEDDFCLSRPLEIPGIDWLRKNDIDFLQIGFLHVTKWESIDILFINIRDSVLRFIKFLGYFSKHFNSKFSSRLLIRELPTSPFQLVPTDIRPGGHCYLISRSFAQSMQSLNDPIIFSADELFVSVSKMRAFNMMRFKKSEVSQTNSPSSVTTRFKSD